LGISTHSSATNSILSVEREFLIGYMAFMLSYNKNQCILNLNLNLNQRKVKAKVKVKKKREFII